MFPRKRLPVWIGIVFLSGMFLMGQGDWGGECVDVDEDGYYAIDSSNCPQGDDCDDNNADVNPEVTEGPFGHDTCSDGMDNDCDGLMDTDDSDCDDFVVTFPDPSLEATIRDALPKPSGDIMASDLQGLNDLNAGSRNVSDITGLEHCINLTELRLNQNQIVDIGPLAGLVNLNVLVLYSNQIVDVSALAGLLNLTNLYLHYNPVVNISALAGLVDLDFLSLHTTGVGDISPLAGLVNLNGLRLQYNQIVDVSALADLVNLTYLDLHSNQIVDVSALADLVNLTWLRLSSNQITDLEPLVSNVGISSGDSVYVTDNPLDATSCTVHIPTLETRGVTVYHNCL